MPEVFRNPFRSTGMKLGVPDPSVDAAAVETLLQHCPRHHQTPLLDLPALAAAAGVSAVYAKDERGRMGLGSFKALGAAYAIAREAAQAVTGDHWSNALSDRTYVTTSAGNHGLSVAVGAKIFGAQAVIYLAETVPKAFANRLTSKGARVVWAGADYEESMAAAEAAAETQAWTLLSDSSWDGYVDPPYHVMEGYLQMASEAQMQLVEPPTHLIVQAGVGGMAAALAAHARAVWGERLTIIVVEPEVAPALIESVRTGHAVTTNGPASSMGRLDCKTPSLIALQSLSRDADVFATLTETEAEQGVAQLAEHGLITTPSGGAGLAIVLSGLELGFDARVLTILSEGSEDG